MKKVWALGVMTLAMCGAWAGRPASDDSGIRRAGIVEPPGVSPDGMTTPLPQGELAGDVSIAGTEGQAVGSGDGRIHSIPSLSAHSVKNGGELSIQVVVEALDGVAKAEVRLGIGTESGYAKA